MPVTCRQMQEIENRAFARGVDAGALMERAGKGIAEVVRQFFPRPGTLVLYLGKGNNAGDALVAARELAGAGWELRARFAHAEAEFKELPAGHWRKLKTQVKIEPDAAAITACKGPLVCLDGLLGIGATGPLRDSMRALAAEMNDLRVRRHAHTVAMDIPSGLNGDTGEACEDCVEADVTATVGQVKTGLLADNAVRHVGRLALVPVDGLWDPDAEKGAEAITSQLLRPLLPRRSFDMHKAQAGRVGLVAGSRNLSGAAILSGLGALRGGGGLVTLLAKTADHALLAAKAPPELMVREVADFREAWDLGFDALGVGPGLGFEHEAEVIALTREAEMPMVIDADALTMWSKRPHAELGEMRGPRLLTPHPGELARFISGDMAFEGLDRRLTAERFVRDLPNTTLLYKGARTWIAQRDRASRCNTTGNPGMATGGIGDVLTGLCAALLAQGMSCHDAASAGSWLIGRAAESAICSGAQSAESLIATDVAGCLGAAFQDLKAGVY